MINRDIIEKIKDATNIEDVISHTVKLKRIGANLQGLCPFHTEKTPSFVVSPARQTYKCFGCGASGDVIAFVQQSQGLSFLEATQALAEQLNIEIPKPSKEENAAFDRRQQLITVLETAQKTFDKNKKNAFDYWQSRGFTVETLADFGVGYADAQLLEKLNFPQDLKKSAGLLSENGKPFFYNRYTLPITDSMGNIIAFAARATGNEQPKYINSPNTELYDKGRILYNLAHARRYIKEKNEVLITEGYADVMMMHQLGYRNIVAVCGTSLTEQHVNELKRINGKDKFLKINLIFNADEAGQKATLKAIPLFVRNGFSVKVTFLKEKDLCDVYTEGGEDAIRETLLSTKDAILYSIESTWKTVNPTTPLEMEEARKRIAKILMNVSAETARERYIRTFAAWVNEDPKHLRKVVTDATGTPQESKQNEAKMRENDTPKIPNFPFKTLPLKVQNIIADCDKYLSYPSDFTACGILSAVAIAIGRKIRVQYIWDEGTVLYTLIVAPPGSNKTHPLKFAVRPIALKDKEQDKIYQNKKQMLLDGMLEANTKIESKQILYSDFTVEALGDGIKDNPSGVGVYIDEIAAWVKNFDRYNKGSEQEFWLQNWSGGSMVINRKGRKNYVEASNIPVVGTIQQGLLDEMAKGGRSLNGFIERVCFCIPENVPILPLKKRKDRATDAYSSIFARYAPIITNILGIGMAEGEDNTKEPHVIIFDEDAEDALTDWANEKRNALQKIDNEYVRNIYSKIQSIAIRFSLILEILNWSCHYDSSNEWDSFEPNNLNIRLETVGKAIEIAEYFLKNALKANSIINFSSPIDKLPKLYKNWYRELNEEFSTADAEKLAIKFDISRETMFRMLKNQDGEKPLFKKIGHGKYEKVFY